MAVSYANRMPERGNYILIASMDVDPDKEDLFNEVYDEEHIPSLLRVPGVHSAERFVQEPLTLAIGGELKTIVTEGEPKHTAKEWAWHGRNDEQPYRPLPRLRDRSAVPHPAPGHWKCHENTFWSAVVRVNDPDLPAEGIIDEAFFDLFSGRVLHSHPAARVLVELWDVHPGTLKIHPLVVEYQIDGVRHYASAFRTDTAFGRDLDRILAARTSSAL